MAENCCVNEVQQQEREELEELAEAQENEEFEKTLNETNQWNTLGKKWEKIKQQIGNLDWLRELFNATGGEEITHKDIYNLLLH